MSQEAKDQEKPDPSDEMEQAQEQAEDDAATQQGQVGRFQTARQAVGRSFDRVTGTESRRQFEEFSSVVTTTVLGVHRDQSDLRQRVEELERITEQMPPAPLVQKLIICLVTITTAAIVLAVIALARTL